MTGNGAASPLRAVVVDDEPIARAGLAALVRRENAIEVIAECASRDEAVAVINRERPHVVFLDVQLSPGTGFEVIQQLQSQATQIVFVTAFDEHAVDAFRAAALDYIVKPVDPARLRVSIERARDRIGLAATSSEHKPAEDLIHFRDGERSLLFSVHELAWIEGADDYVQLHARGRRWLVRERLDALEFRLPASPFVRVHRSAIVNIAHISVVRRVSRHRHVAVLRDGTVVAVSTTRRKALDARLSRT